jgi:hypothetical protein
MPIRIDLEKANLIASQSVSSQSNYFTYTHKVITLRYKATTC